MVKSATGIIRKGNALDVSPGGSDKRPRSIAQVVAQKIRDNMADSGPELWMAKVRACRIDPSSLDSHNKNYAH